MRLGGRRLAGLSSLTTGSVLGHEEARVGDDLHGARRGPVWRSFHREQQALVRETTQIERRLGQIAVQQCSRRYEGHRRPAECGSARSPQRCRNAVVREVDAGHLMTLEAPQAVAAAIRETVALADLGSSAKPET